MGLFDKIKDNARDISMKAIESTREYDEDFFAEQPAAAEPVDDTPAEITETPETTPEEKPADTEPADKADADKADKEAPKKSKITEVPKEEFEKTAKPAAKATAKSRVTEVPKSSLHNYTPSYKTQPKQNTSKKSDDNEKGHPKSSAKKAVKVIDVTPKKIVDPTKQAIYARERAALAALASQRKLNGAVALYITQHLNFKTRVYVDRIEYSGSFGKTVIPIEQVSWVKLRAFGTGVILETVEGKRVVLVVKPKDRLDFADAILKVQLMQPKREKFKDTRTVRIDQLERFSEGVDEIEKLAKLFDKGILNQSEFDAKKKQILGL